VRATWQAASTIERATFLFLIVASYPLAIITYNHLGEDAYISFRYARNFAEGHGLVFNIGHREEGYSNLLWVIILAAGKFIGISFEVFSRLASLIFISMGMCAAWWGGRRLLAEDAPAWLRLWPAAGLLLHPLLRYHSDRGLETVAIAVCVGISALVLAGGGGLWIAGSFGAMVALLRPEGIGFALCLVPVAMATASGDWRARVMQGLRYAALPLGAFATQMIFRKLYYDAWLPNTVVAKRHGDPGAWRDLATWVLSSGGLPIVAALGALRGIILERFRALSIGVLCIFIASIAFQLFAGKLINEGWRYISPAFVATIFGTWIFVGIIANRLHFNAAAKLLGGLTIVLTAVLFSQKPEPGKDRWFEGNRDALRSRMHVRFLEFVRRPELGFYWSWYFGKECFINAEAGRWARANLPPKATIAGDQLGQLGYFGGEEQQFLDLLGLMDKRIARFGATPEEIIARNPEYFVLFCFADDVFWPRDLRGKPMVASVRDLMAHPEIQARWHPAVVLESRETLTHANFTVWERGPAEDPTRVEPIGLTTAEFERRWRVLERE